MTDCVVGGQSLILIKTLSFLQPGRSPGRLRPFYSMILEERIKQSKPFKSHEERLVVNLLYTATWILEQIRTHLEKYEITQQQYNVMRILRGQYPEVISTSDIRDRMVDRAPDTSRIVDRLVLKGYAEKSTCASDKRRVDVKISKKGLKLLEVIDQDNMRIEHFVSKLSSEEARELNRLLDVLKS